MKTVLQAFSELKGDLKNSLLFRGEREGFLVMNDDESLAVVDKTRLIGSRDVICTVKEFNALVAEMETNFGKYTGAKFDASKAAELEVSKVDADWSEAPEGS